MNKIYKKLLLLTSIALLGGCSTSEEIDYFKYGFHAGGNKPLVGMCVALKGERHQGLNISYQVYLGHYYGLEQTWNNNEIEISEGIYFQKKETSRFALKRIIEDSENKAVEVKYTVYNDFPNHEKYLYSTDGKFHGYDAWEYVYQYYFDETIDLSTFGSYLTKGIITYKMVCYDVSAHEEVEMGLYDGKYYYNDKDGNFRTYKNKMNPNIAFVDFEINENKVLLQPNKINW